jgi:hypothetical protein
MIMAVIMGAYDEARALSFAIWFYYTPFLDFTTRPTYLLLHALYFELISFPWSFASCALCPDLSLF